MLHCFEIVESLRRRLIVNIWKVHRNQTDGERFQFRFHVESKISATIEINKKAAGRLLIFAA